MPAGSQFNEEDLRVTLSRSAASSARELAQEFGWINAESRQITRGDTKLDVARCSVAGEPAALFATVVTRNGYDPLDSAALYAYHATVDWGVLADDIGITVFNSHWLVDGDWFRLPRVRWDNLQAGSEIFSALTPKNLIDGAIERSATRQLEPSAFLKPVDDELVERLDNWRDQALRFARDTRFVDQHLQTLYAQLFVLRTIQDRKLDLNVPPLSEVLDSSESIDRVRWQNLLEIARSRIGSDLFNEDAAADIPNHVVAGVISDLYRPRGLPGRGAQYDFSWIEADVLGLAYEKYLATILQPAPAAPQFEMFLAPEREVERLTVRKRSGAYYTPKFISGYLATRCVDEYFATSKDGLPPRVIDFACGSGSFLVAAVDQILKHLKRRDPDRNWARELMEGGYVVGIDIDSRAVTTARLHLWQRLAQEPDALPLPNLSEFVVVADGLQRDTWGDLDKPYDIVLGNPPFLAINLIQDRDQLEAAFATTKGRYDFSYLFVEQALNVLSESGTLGMVVPNRIFKNRNGTVIRGLLVEQVNLLSIVDFGSTRPFDAGAYVGCIVARRRFPPGSPPARQVRVLDVRSLDPTFLTVLLLEATLSESETDVPAIRAYFARHPTSGAPWPLLSEREQRSLILIEDASVRLDTLAAIPQGIRTGGNDLFLFFLESEDGSHLCKATNGLGETATMEIEFLEPVVYGSEVQRYQPVNSSRRIFYPYRNNSVVSETELEARFPNTWLYLLRNKDLLAARASLIKSGGKWFELVWPRDETWLRKPKLLIRDLAPRTAFAADQEGSTFLVGGTAVVPEQPEMLLPLLAYLNSSVINALVKRTTPQFRGDFQKFEPQHIQSIPILRRVVDDEAFASRLSYLAARIIRMRLEGVEAQAVETEFEVDGVIRQAAREQGIELEG
jgi:hypothetical protein